MPDFRVAAPEARFAANFTRLGFHPGFSLTFTLPRLIGQQRANLMFLTGRRIGGEQAVEWGLADVLAPLADVRKEAMKLAAEIAESAPLAVMSTRETMRRGFADGAEAATERELTEQDWTRKTEDFKEGVKSYAEKRAGQLEGPLVAQLAGKAAIVTGGASGIGEACSRDAGARRRVGADHRHRRRAGQGRRRRASPRRAARRAICITTCATKRHGPA